MTTKAEIRDYFAKFGKEGGKTRAKNMTPEERSAAARKAVEARWAKERAETKALRDDAQKLLAQSRKRQAQIEKNRGL
jgi:hypothetical protein